MVKSKSRKYLITVILLISITLFFTLIPIGFIQQTALTFEKRITPVNQDGNVVFKEGDLLRFRILEEDGRGYCGGSDISPISACFVWHKISVDGLIVNDYGKRYGYIFDDGSDYPFKCVEATSAPMWNDVAYQLTPGFHTIKVEGPQTSCGGSKTIPYPLIWDPDQSQRGVKFTKPGYIPCPGVNNGEAIDCGSGSLFAEQQIYVVPIKDIEQEINLLPPGEKQKVTILPPGSVTTPEQEKSQEVVEEIIIDKTKQDAPDVDIDGAEVSILNKLPIWGYSIIGLLIASIVAYFAVWRKKR